MNKSNNTDQKRFTRNTKIAIYGRIFFWVFFTILSVEAIILSASFLISRNTHLSPQEQSVILILFGCLLSIIIAFSIIWALRLVLSVYDQELNIRTDEEFDLLNDLETALERNELVIFFQPQSNLQSGHIIGMETLLRWQHPVKGTIMPSVFIPIAENGGLIDEISEWMMIQACIHNKRLLDKGYDLRVAVNLSPLQFRNPDLVMHVSRILTLTQLPAKNLELEITETAMMDDIEYAIRVMMELRALGLALAIDDFGMGYSSLSELDRLPVDKLKIDKAFIQSINMNDLESTIAYSIVQIGHKLNLQIAVEGIETEQQKRIFTQLQCHEAQGYYISAPIPAEQFSEFLANFARNSRTQLN